MSRDHNVDNLRGLSMILMIVIHTTAYFLKDKIAYFLWDTLMFVVPVFIFCSVYLFFKRKISINRNNIIPYLKKRIGRLLIPYYVFLSVLFVSMYFIGHEIPSLSNIFQNIFLYGGLDLNWLPLLFIYITFLNPLVAFLKKNKFLFYLFFILSFSSSVVFIFLKANYRAVMWLPWALLIYFTKYFVENQKSIRKIFYVFIISFVIYILSYYFESFIGQTLNHYTNNYPPTIYQLSYGIFWTIFLYYLSKIGLFKILKAESIFLFFSIYSYEIYFIHNFIFYLFAWLQIRFNNWILFTVVIGGLTVLIQLAFIKIIKGLNTLKNI